MRIADYLKSNQLTDEDFAAKSGPEGFSAEAVRKWRFGARTPRPRQMEIIVRLTNGDVTPNDFMSAPSNAEAAA